MRKARSSKDLPAVVASGGFREDLYYRLNVVGLTVPPLRERRDDIPLLARQFLDGFARQNRKTLKGFTPQAMSRLVAHGWPGNVRELMNAMERAVVLATGDFLSEADFPIAAGARTAEPPAEGSLGLAGSVPLEAVEKATILKTLEASGGEQERSRAPAGHHPAHPAQETQALRRHEMRRAGRAPFFTYAPKGLLY